ncbi:hypothetical protein [Bradyrhizobium lablabi]|uniref:hypothetical protein n=1 Tax=Bradyrhizobium lablabi TaxID=722472 RepID=UPI001BAB929A|nr:hypothetical protein [Bradyrhizobium lablabi]MBR0696140.1 hypothetical protein [Bradyrhizobium lablabi]
MSRMLAYSMALAALFAFAGDANANCRRIGPLVQPGSGQEPRCITTSDGAYEPYTDGRDKSASSGAYRRYAERRRAWREGANHTEDMATGGTMHGNILVSPFVPGSVQDQAWQSERKRKGLCGNDRLCLGAR